MIARPEECDPGRLSRLLEDILPATEQLELTRHLDSCPHCREQLEHLTADEIWWTDTQAALSDQSTTLPNALQATQLKSRSSMEAGQPLAGQHATGLNATGGSDLAATEKQHFGSAEGENLSRAEFRETVDARASELASQEQLTADHWVMALLSPSDDAQAMGQVDSMPIHSVVGQGGMGVVLKARDTSLHRFLAVKLLSPMLASSGAARQRFLREAQAAAAIVHPNIVPIYAVSTERQLPYLVMPFVAGGNLQQHLDELGPLPLERTLSIGLQVAEGLSAAHRQGIVHRDIKPANLMFDEGGFRVMLTDFGLARALDDASLTASGMVAGTPQFMSPEQARGRVVDHRSDIYSLGAVLYALATGRPPVRGDSTLDVLRRIGEDQPTPVLELNERYPSWFQRLVELLMAKDIGQRLQTAEEAAELLRACLAHARRPQKAALPQRLRVNRAWLPVTAVSLLCIASFVVGGLVWSQGLVGTVRPTAIEFSPSAAESPARINDFAAAASPVPTGSLADSVMAAEEHWNASSIETQLVTAEQELQLLTAELLEPQANTPSRP